jgi:ribosomal protein L16 Arg81 hydroxylase
LDEDKLGAIKDAMEDEKNPYERSFEERFGWYVVLNRVAQDDISRHTEITEKSIIEILNQLSYIIEKEKHIEVETKRARGQIS